MKLSKDLTKKTLKAKSLKDNGEVDLKETSELSNKLTSRKLSDNELENIAGGLRPFAMKKAPDLDNK